MSGFSQDKHSHAAFGSLKEDPGEKLAKHIKFIDELVAHIGKTASELEALGVPKEAALEASVRLHDSESYFFPRRGHDGH